MKDGDMYACFLASIFFLLGTMHVYWACGGKKFKKITVPEKEGRPLFIPGFFSTLLVALFLYTLTLFILSYAHFLPLLFNRVHLGLTLYLLSGVFFLRAIGDFNYLGFFKKVRSGKFAKWDTYIFSPLSFLLGLGLLELIRLYPL